MHVYLCLYYKFGFQTAMCLSLCVHSQLTKNGTRYFFVHQISCNQGLQKEFCKAEQDCFGGTRDKLRLLSKFRIRGPIKPLVNFHKCFIFCAAECPESLDLNKLKIVENTKKLNKLKQSVTKAMGPFRDSQSPSWNSGPRTDVPVETPSHRPCL